jgi:spore coat protein E
MTSYKEIVTKAVIAKGKKIFTTDNVVRVEHPSTILGCWIINHNFQGKKQDNHIVITGSYDVNIWYSYDHDSKTDVLKKTNTYQEVVHMREVEDVTGEEIIVRSLRQPNCVKIEIDGSEIVYTIEKELGIELVGDVKVRIEANEEEELWDEIGEESTDIEDSTHATIDQVKEDYIDESTAI